MTIIDDLIGDPVGFLSRNALNFTGAVSLQAGKEGDFYVVPNPSFHVRYRTGSKFLGLGNAKANGAAFTVRFRRPGEPVPTNAETFRAIWSGYKGGAATYCTLSSTGGADLMLTPRMDGCTMTFAADGDNNMKFGHCNIKDGQDTVSAREMGEAIEEEFQHDHVTIFSKEHYYSYAKRTNASTGDKRTIVNAVGIRDGEQWAFYVQYLESKGVGQGSGFQIRGAEKLDEGAKYISAV